MPRRDVEGSPSEYSSTGESNHNAVQLYDWIAERSGFIITESGSANPCYRSVLRTRAATLYPRVPDKIAKILCPRSTG